MSSLTHLKASINSQSWLWSISIALGSVPERLQVNWIGVKLRHCSFFFFSKLSRLSQFLSRPAAKHGGNSLPCWPGSFSTEWYQTHRTPRNSLLNSLKTESSVRHTAEHKIHCFLFAISGFCLSFPQPDLGVFTNSSLWWDKSFEFRIPSTYNGFLLAPVLENVICKSGPQRLEEQPPWELLVDAVFAQNKEARIE